MKLTGWRPGPGMLVTAAFIGPGTVTTASLAGAQYGTALVWALVFATIATIVLQGMAARVALVTRQGLAEAMLASAAYPAARIAIALLVLAALGVGNAAYQAGNLLGGGLGFAAMAGGDDDSARVAALVLAAIAALLIALGSPKWLERLLIALVLAMSISFVGALALVGVDWGELARGLVPNLPDGATLAAIGLIGTTIVPYNLFLHAARVREAYAGPEALPEVDTDTFVSILIGGLISIAILLVAAQLADGTRTIESAADLARQLKPVFGDGARIAMGLGLAGAGVSSALTAPLATGYVVKEIVGAHDPTIAARWFKGTALAVVAVGAALTLLDLKPTEAILLAQVANGLLLPGIAFFLLWLASRRSAMGDFALTMRGKAVGFAICLVALSLGLRLIAGVLF